MEFLMGLDR